MTKKYMPIEVTDADLAFGGKAMEILPKWGDIPEEFKRDRNPWVQWQRQWFFRGLEKRPTPKEGIDGALAMKNLACVQGSFAPKHEHKEAGVAYLASLWFASPDGEPIKKAA